jgi:hypothetical protein
MRLVNFPHLNKSTEVRGSHEHVHQYVSQQGGLQGKRYGLFRILETF